MQAERAQANGIGPGRDAKRLSVLFFALEYYPAAAGGAERQARLQAEELVRRRHRVSVVCGRSRGQRSGTVNGVVVHRLPNIRRRPITKLTYLMSLCVWLLRHGREHDVWHVHLANLQADVVVLMSLLLRRPVYVKVAMGGALGEVGRMKKVAWFTRYIGLRRASRVQALSQEIVDDLRSIGVKDSQVVVIPNGLDLRSFAPEAPRGKSAAREGLGLPANRPIVLFVGRFARYKGIADLLEAWRRVRRPDALLVLVGGPSVDSPYQMPATENGLVVRDWTDDVLAYLHAADVFVYPSHADGMSNALLEALACGLPTVATDIRATHEVLEHGKNGVLVPPRSPADLSRALHDLLADPARREILAEAAHRTAQRFSIESVVDQIERVYADMVGASAPGARRPLSAR